MSTLIALKKLEEQLKCAICLEDYKDPKVLQCFHVFCQNCLGHRRMVVQNEEGGRSFICPTCRQPTPIPPSGVSGLQSAFHINHLLEIQESLKKSQDSASSERESESNSITPVCPEHAKKELELYTKMCGMPICLKCGRGGENHEYEEISEAFEKYKKEVTPSLKWKKSPMKRINRALTKMKRRRDEISNIHQTIKADVNDSIRRFRGFFKVKETELIGQLHGITQGKMTSLAVQKDHLESIHTQLSSGNFDLEEGDNKGDNKIDDFTFTLLFFCIFFFSVTLFLYIYFYP